VIAHLSGCDERESQGCLFFAATQLPIYLIPRLIDMIISQASARKPS
jgi:hypothetical protein